MKRPNHKADYLVIFTLSKDNSQRNYSTLLSLIDELWPGPVLNGADGGPVPMAVLFHSAKSLAKLREQIQEHLYEGYQALLLRASAASLVGSPKATEQQFQDFLRGL